MSRPRPHDQRLTTAIRFDRDLHDELVAAAVERDVSVNWLVNKAVQQFLDKLIPVEEMVWTKEEP